MKIGAIYSHLNGQEYLMVHDISWGRVNLKWAHTGLENSPTAQPT